MRICVIDGQGGGIGAALIKRLKEVYGEGAAATLAALAAANLLRPRAWVVAEHSRRETLPEAGFGLEPLTLRRYGDTQVAFYRALDNPVPKELADA